MNTRQQLTLLILAVLDRQPEHGYAIVQAIKARSSHVLDARESNLYPALHALEAQGLIESQEQIVQGRTRREYRLTQKGRTQLAQQRRQWAEQVQAVQAILDPA